MRWITRLRLRIRSLARKSRVEQDLQDELRAHLDHEIDARVAAGQPREAARAQALRALGGLEQVKEDCRDTRRVARLEHLWQDVRYGARMLRQSPGFTLVAVLSLALGIGATTAIFSVVHAVLLRPLPFPHPERLVLVRELLPKITPDPIAMPAPDTLEFARAESFESSATMVDIGRQLSGVTTPEQVRGQRVSPSLFAVLGVAPRLGRAFTAEEDQPGRQVVILSDALWQRQFARDPGLIGRTILLDRQPHEVVGIMPPGFSFPLRGMWSNVDADVFVPLALTKEERERKGDNFNYAMIARLRPGVTLERANAEALVIAERIHASYPSAVRQLFELRAAVLPLFDRVTGGSRRLLALLFGAVALLLIIACANVANMLLSRATSRGRELALRMALGATRGRIVRQLLTESVLLSLLGGALGAAFASTGTTLLLRWLPGDLPRTGEVRVDATVLTFAIVLSVLTGLLFGLAPALGASKRGVPASLRDAGKGMGSVAHGNWLRQGLAVTELALALVLLTGAGLLLRSFLFVLQSDPGFKPDGAISLSLSLPSSHYDTDDKARGFYDRLLTDLSALPGVRDVGAGSDLPFNKSWTRMFTLEKVTLAASIQPLVTHTVVHRQFFEALGMPLRQGRLFTDADRADAPLVLLVNDVFVRRFSPDRDIVGTRIKWGTPTNKLPWITIVGVVGSVSQEGPDREPGPQVYAPAAQQQEGSEALRSLSVVLRVDGDPVSLLPAVRDRVRALDAHLPLESLQTMEQAASKVLAPRRATAGVVTVFAVSALLLAALGLYGVLAHSVGQRSQEFGIRLVLGAEPRTVLGLVLRHGLTLALAGVTIGVALSALLARTMASLLYGIGPFDPGVMVAVPLTLVAVALLACAIPARRAVRVDPIRTLRME